MKFYIVDNGSQYLKYIQSRLTGHEYATARYSPNTPLYAGDADIIILSGGMDNEVTDSHPDGYPWYHHEFDLIRGTNKPILGICLGLQMVTVALGGSVRQMPELMHADKSIKTNLKGQKILGRETIHVHKRHQWVLDDISTTGLDVLATSPEGVEIAYHPKRKIIATQFHPEIDSDEHTEKLFWDLIGIITVSGQKPALLAQ